MTWHFYKHVDLGKNLRSFYSEEVWLFCKMVNKYFVGFDEIKDSQM